MSSPPGYRILFKLSVLFTRCQRSYGLFSFENVGMTFSFFSCQRKAYEKLKSKFSAAVRSLKLLISPNRSTQCSKKKTNRKISTAKSNSRALPTKMSMIHTFNNFNSFSVALALSVCRCGLLSFPIRPNSYFFSDRNTECVSMLAQQNNNNGITHYSCLILE